MRYGLQRLETLPVSVRLIREIHQRLLQSVRGSRLVPGELRTSQNWIGPAGCTLNEAIFVPPPPDRVPAVLSDLERFLHRKDDLPILIKIGMAHAQFETIHPFLDGNGRIGRLLIAFLLCSSDVLHKPVLYPSHYFKRYQQAYYDRLQDIRDLGAWEDWFLFFLHGIIDVSEQATETARRILKMREEHRNGITKTLGYAAGNGHCVLETLYEKPIVSLKDVEAVIGTSFAAANQLVKRLKEMGLLEEITGQIRNRLFRYTPYIQLFADYETEVLEPLE